MPFNQESIRFKDVEVHLMYFKNFHPQDYLDQLTDGEKERFFSFKHINRQCEFVATRILRHQLLGFTHIHYDVHGAPYIEDEGYISISHAPGVVGIAISKHFKVGLDLEIIRDKAKVLSSRFISEIELKQFNNESSIEMTMLWSAKEVLYKLAGRKKIIFKKELLLQKINDSELHGTIINPDSIINVDLAIFVRKDLIISFNSNACRTEN